MAPIDLLMRLDDRFRLLRTARGEADHHDALQATVDWSYRLMSDMERIVFDRLSVFTGDFDLCAAESTCAGDTIDRADVAIILMSLVDKSMVVAERRSEGARYRLLETLRQFAHNHLHEANAISQVRSQHMLHFLEIGETRIPFSAAPDRFRVPRSLTEWHNLRTAHQWAVATNDLAVAERLIAASMELAARSSESNTVNGSIRRWLCARQRVDPTLTRMGRERSGRLSATRWHKPLSSSNEGWMWPTGLTTPGSRCRSSIAGWPGAPQLADPRLPTLESLADKLDLDREWWVLVHLADWSSRVSPQTYQQHLSRLVATAARACAEADDVSGTGGRPRRAR
jgi:hypothetical protein